MKLLHGLGELRTSVPAVVDSVGEILWSAPSHFYQLFRPTRSYAASFKTDVLL